MTSETEALKTNEFLRRRKLRIQQVREQSKEIAKKIRQRAKVEKLRHLGDIDAKKEKEYFQHQEKLVKRLEHLYAESLRNVGTSHKNASEVKLQEDVQPNPDLSKKRGKEAAAELRRMKQKKLDEQKKLLDRKLQARETANEISREKSATVATKLLGKPSSSKIIGVEDDKIQIDVDKPDVVTTDMATQWDFDELPNEWGEPHIPELSLPVDDRDSFKEYVRNVDSRSQKNKRLNLFALSDEMPSSLRGGLTSVPEEDAPTKPSLTLVSEYLQNRGLRLRESDVIVPNKKHVDDLQSLKQTIIRTRSSKLEGSNQNVCHVADIQVVPVPSWQAETSCGFCPHHEVHRKHSVKSREFKTVTNSQINKIFSSIRPLQHDIPSPTPVLRGSSPFRRSKLLYKFSKGKTEEKSKSSEPDSALSKKNPVMMYNHSTRDTKDVLCGDKKLVIRDPQTDEDAYSQAMKESSSNITKDQDHQKKLQDMRNKIAMTKQSVEKEYKDTMAFLRSLPKDKSKPIKNAYRNDQRQQLQKESHQRKMQQEFKKIEKECRRQVHLNPNPKATFQDKTRNRSKSPANLSLDDDFNSKDFQYSWMPVPESDGNLAIHTIPTTLKEGKPGNSVKFSKVDSYHEYRSRHKHTPPTKDIMGPDKHTNKRVVEAVVIDKNESTDCSSIASDTSSVENLELDNDKIDKSEKKTEKLSDAERIIIYKILDSKIEKRDRVKQNSKILKEIAKSLTSIDKEKLVKSFNTDRDSGEKVGKPQSVKRSKQAETRVSFEQLNEGLYKTVNEKGDNITTMYFSDSPREGEKINSNKNDGKQCSCGNKHCKALYTDAEVEVNWESGDDPAAPRLNAEHKCVNSKNIDINRPVHTSEVSTSSFKTATNDRANVLQEGDFIKLLEEGSQDTGKFYIGATGFLKDDDYEVIIQLRKKEAAKEERQETEKQCLQSKSPTSVKVLKKSHKEQTPDTHSTSEAVAAQKNIDTKYLQSANKNTNVVQSQSPPSNQETIDVVVPQNQPNIGNREQSPSSSASNDNISDEPLRQTGILTDKSVYTPVQLSYAVSSNMKKTEPGLRPGKSTFTQTTFGTPDQRPVFVHMSSSTSTAYMSPPEMILPKFLKHDYKISYDEMCDLTQNSNLQDGRIELIDQETVRCEEYTDCRCKKCTHARKIIVSRMKPNTTSKLRDKPSENKVITPTYTSRSTDQECEKINISQGPKKGVTNFVNKNMKSSSRKCVKHSSSKNCHKNHSHNNRRNIPLNKRCSRNFVFRVNANAPATYKANRNSLLTDKKNNKRQINPVVKSYVDKLLCLNRQSITAIEVMNQDCSLVTTPGSSIIDVARNADNDKPAENKISLEQMKDMLLQQIIEDVEKNTNTGKLDTVTHTDGERLTKKTFQSRAPRKKSLHKVKSLNISKHILKTKPLTTQDTVNSVNCVSSSSSTSTKAEDSGNRKLTTPMSTTSISRSCRRTKSRSKSSPSPRNIDEVFNSKTTISDIVSSKISVNIDKSNTKINLQPNSKMTDGFDYERKLEKRPEPTRSQSRTSTSSESGRFYVTRDKSEEPLNISTQTSRIIDNDINFMKLAENKLQNMEKIADLTEKCTKRLSNLAKVLEEVRKNKSMVYSQISDSASDSDRISDKIITQYKPPTPSLNLLEPATLDEDAETKLPTLIKDPPFEVGTIVGTGVGQQGSEKNIAQNKSSIPSSDSRFDIGNPKETITHRNSEKDVTKTKPLKSPNDYIEIIVPQNSEVDVSHREFPTSQDEPTKIKNITSNLTDYVPFLTNIPKPGAKTVTSLDTRRTTDRFNDHQSNKTNETIKIKGKPPPALSRIHLKDSQDYIIPHELSTVLEVDSPMSIRAKNQNSYNDVRGEITDHTSNSDTVCNKEKRKNDRLNTDQQINPDILVSNIELTRRQSKTSSTDSSEDSKLQMMDLKQFNDIMLKPFISIQEYAKQCNIEVLDEGSNLDDVLRDGVVNDDLNSLHSDGSLPDVIAELLKRNIISEPFKFDTASNVNSTSISSESTLSVLALSKVRKEKKKSSVFFQNKENIAETSDTLSFSSNPDLENAFKKLGMGWASSTLKKTKERLALSSSSNTSSSSVSQFKLKGYKNQDAPVLVSDTVSSVLNVSKKPLKDKVPTESSKNAEQQTSQVNSMTVKEFLTNELAKKITFTNKSRDETEEFMTLYETRMPEELKHSSQMVREERSIDSGPNGSSINRARTSTPVQLFKSMTYHSSSSSNLSNGLFSNADDLSSVKGTSNSMRNHSTSDKDDLTIPNYSLRMRKSQVSDCSKSD